jgi:peptide/nickel transport system substrate-binding protein
MEGSYTTPDSYPPGSGGAAGPLGASRRSLLKAAFGIGALGSAGAAMTLISACDTATRSVPAASTKAASVPRRGGVLRAGLSGGASSDTLNPLATVTNVDSARASQLFDPLVGFGSSSAQPVLQLAEEITPNTDATAWTIRLRSGVSFHNGKSLSADDVIYTFRTIMNPKSPGDGAALLSTLDVSGMTKLDDLTVRLPFTSPFSPLLPTLASYYFPVIPVGFNPARPVGTGPFRYGSFTAGVRSYFPRNDNYWEEGRPYFDAISITEFADETSQINALLSGQVDVIDLLSADAVPTLRSGGMQVHISSGGGFIPFTMRVDRAPFNDHRVRQAFRLMVDRGQMRELVFGGYGRLGNDVYSPWDPVYDHSLPQREQDLSQAKFLLKQAGQEHLVVELVTADISAGAVQSALVLAQQAQSAGVTVNVRQLTTTDFFGPNYLKWTFAQDNWAYNPYLPTVGFADAPGAAFDETGFGPSDPAYTSLYRQALATTDKAKQTEICHQMQQIYYNYSGYVIPNFQPQIVGSTAKVQGIPPSPVGESFNNFEFRNMWFS